MSCAGLGNGLYRKLHISSISACGDDVTREIIQEKDNVHSAVYDIVVSYDDD